LQGWLRQQLEKRKLKVEAGRSGSFAWCNHSGRAGPPSFFYEISEAKFLENLNNHRLFGRDL